MEVEHHGPVAEGTCVAVRIVLKLRPADQVLNQGRAVADNSIALKVSPATYKHRQQLHGACRGNLLGATSHKQGN